MPKRSDETAVCTVCELLPCACGVPGDPNEAWLWKEEIPEMTTAEFLAWHRKMGYGDVMRFEEPVEIPWTDLVRLVSAILLFLGQGQLNPDEIARGVLPMIRGSTTRAREG